MKYYKVLKDHCDVVENELLTKEELKKYTHNKKYLKIVEVKKTNTFKSFGCRFEKIIDKKEKA